MCVLLRQCCYRAQVELAVSRGLKGRRQRGQERGRKAERRGGRLKVLDGELAGEEGRRLQRAGRGRLRRGHDVDRGGGKDLRLELQELTHEAEVGRDEGPTLFDDVEGFVQLQPLGPHDVGHADGGRARDACLTVNQDLAARLLHTIWNHKRGQRRDTSIKKWFWLMTQSFDSAYASSLMYQDLRFHYQQQS